jgi:hypothetical protein
MTTRAGPVTADTLGPVLAREVADGARFAGLFGTATPAGVVLSAHLADGSAVRAVDALVEGTATQR